MKNYLTYLDYFAKDEGRIIEVTIMYADNKEEAINKHGEKFKYSPDMLQYYGQGIAVFPLSSNDAKEILGFFVKNPSQIIKTWKKGGLDFAYTFRFNFYETIP